MKRNGSATCRRFLASTFRFYVLFPSCPEYGWFPHPVRTAGARSPFWTWADCWGADDQPDGEDALGWLRVKPEIQMWLAARPVSHNRKKRGLPGDWTAYGFGRSLLPGSSQGGTLFADTVWSRFHPEPPRIARQLPRLWRNGGVTCLLRTISCLWIDLVPWPPWQGTGSGMRQCCSQWEERWFAHRFAKPSASAKSNGLDIASGRTARRVRADLPNPPTGEILARRERLTESGESACRNCDNAVSKPESGFRRHFTSHHRRYAGKTGMRFCTRGGMQSTARKPPMPAVMLS